MRDLATHYRIAEVDTVSKEFIGEVKDVWGNDTVMIAVTYNLQGLKNGSIKVMNPAGELKVIGQYELKGVSFEKRTSALLNTSEYETTRKLLISFKISFSPRHNNRIHYC